MTVTETREEPHEEVTAPVPVSPPPSAPVSAAVAPGAFSAGVATRALSLVAAGVLGFVGYLLLLTPLEQSANQDVLYSRLRGPIAEGVPPYAGAAVSADGAIEREVPPVYDDGEDDLIPVGAPIALLRIPRLGLEQVVVEGTSAEALMSGPGHRRDTVLPGQAGISVVYGRAVTFGGPFERVPQLRPGDTITVVTFQGEFGYEVEGVHRDGDPRPAPPEEGSRLTLVTAEGGNPFQPDHTVLVDANLRGEPQQAARHPTDIPPEEKALASDVPALLNTVLWTQLLLVVSVAIAWARIRWGRWETHLVGVPVVLGVLWYVYESFSRLLPNLT